MAYDELQADRVRAAVGPAEERKMFGGLAFLVAGHMTVCLSGQGGLMVRVAADDRDALLGEPHVEPMEMAGRTSRTWVHVLDAGIASDDALAGWVERGLAACRDLPPKA